MLIKLIKGKPDSDRVKSKIFGLLGRREIGKWQRFVTATLASVLGSLQPH